MNTERFPDIEIYALTTDQNKIVEWLETVFSSLSEPRQHGNVFKLEGKRDSSIIPVTITPEAAGKRFTSIIFDSSETPWVQDLDCARAAFKFLQTEIRCSASSWIESEGEVEKEEWWKINAKGEVKISWNN